MTFNMDEYLGFAPSDLQSYHYFMYDKFFNHIDIPRENIHILNGLAANIDEECANYEKKIKQYGRIDLFLGGLGPEGHLAFNEAGSSRNSKQERSSWSKVPSGKLQVFRERREQGPKYALSVGISTILDNSDEIAIIVLGKVNNLHWTKL